MSDKPQMERIEIPVTSSLPLSKTYQSALIGHVLTDERIFAQIQYRVRPSWFVDIWHAKIFGMILEFATERGKSPNKQEFLENGKLTAEDLPTRKAIVGYIEKAVVDSTQIRWEAIKPELTDWLQSKILQETIRKSVNLWNGQQWQKTARLMQAAVQEFRDAHFDDGVEIPFDNEALWLARHTQEKKEALTTGLKLLDSALLDGGIGGLQRGDTTVVMAPSNTGKTTCLLTIARHNVMAGKNVLLMTHEGRPEDIRLKMLKATLNRTEQEVFALYADPTQQHIIQAATQTLKKQLTYIPYNKAGMKVEDVVPIIRRAQEERIARTGKGYDLLVVDYPAKLTTDQSRANLALRNVLEIVYDFYVQLALEYQFHSLLAIQTNREGSKVNTGMNNTNRVLMMEDVQEAWGPMTSASNVITLNRSPTAKRMNRILMHVAKSRSSETGCSVVAKSDFGRGLTHGCDMASTAYYGTSTMENKIDAFLNSHNGKIIEPELVR